MVTGATNLAVVVGRNCVVDCCEMNVKALDNRFSAKPNIPLPPFIVGGFVKAIFGGKNTVAVAGNLKLFSW